MYIQTVVERDSVKANRGETYKLDLPKTGLLSSLHIFASADKVSNASETGGKWRLVDWLTKIEVLANASTPIKSLSAREAQALAFWDTGKVAADVWRSYASNTEFASILLNFGRWPCDPRMALDLLGTLASGRLQRAAGLRSCNAAVTVALVEAARGLQKRRDGSQVG